MALTTRDSDPLPYSVKLHQCWHKPHPFPQSTLMGGNRPPALKPTASRLRGRYPHSACPSDPVEHLQRPALWLGWVIPLRPLRAFCQPPALRPRARNPHARISELTKEWAV